MIDFNNINTNSDLGLRDYQLKYKNEIYRIWKTHNNVMLQMPTGTGKTRVFSSIVKDMHSLAKQQKKAIKVLILVHRRELIEQASETIGYKYKIAHGIIMSKYWQQKKMPIQIASVQTLSRRLSQWEDKDFDFIIIDEAHHAIANSYNKICKTFPDAKILGVTATPYRLNGAPFNKMFDKLITSTPINDFIKQGYLSDYQYFSIKPDSITQKSINNIDEFDINGDYSERAMLKVIDNIKVRADILRAYKTYAEGKKGIVYTINKNHNKRICDLFNEAGIKAQAIDSDTKINERAESISKFKSGQIKVLCNVNIFSEGFDCPDIEFIQIARPTASLSLFLQQVGRGLRPHSDIDKVVFLDNVGSYNKFGLPSQNRDWEKYFNGYAELPRIVTSQDANSEVSFMTEINEGDENVELLYSGVQTDKEFDEIANYEIITKQNGYINFSLFGRFCGFEFDELSKFIEEGEFDEDENEDFFGLYKRENRYYEKDFRIISHLVKTRKNGFWGIYDSKTNSNIVDLIYDDILPPNGLGFAILTKNSKKGLLDMMVKSVVIPCEYDDIESLYYFEYFHFYLVEKNGKYGIVDDKNIIILPLKYDEIVIRGEIFNVRNGNEWRVFENGKEDFPNFEIIEEIGKFTRVKFKDYEGLWDNSENCLVYPFYCDSIDFKYNTYKLSYENNFHRKFEALLDNSLDIIIPYKYSHINFLNDIYLKFKPSDLSVCGVLDKNGSLILSPIYQDIDLCKNGFVARKDNEWLIIDINGNTLHRNRKKKIVLKEYYETLGIDVNKIKKKTKRARRKVKMSAIKESWALMDSFHEDVNNQKGAQEAKKIIYDVTENLQTIEYKPDISYEAELAILKRISTKEGLGKKHKEFMKKVKESKGNDSAVLHFSSLAKEVRQLIGL